MSIHFVVIKICVGTCEKGPVEAEIISELGLEYQDNLSPYPSSFKLYNALWNLIRYDS